MKQYITNALRVVSLAALFYIIYHQREQINTLKDGQSIYLQEDRSPTDDSLQTVIDMLRGDLYKANEENTRYELGLEQLKKSNPQVAEQLEDYIYGK
jgi:hypothetical protein